MKPPQGMPPQGMPLPPPVPAPPVPAPPQQPAPMPVPPPVSEVSLAAMLANANPEQQKQMLGERLFPQVLEFSSSTLFQVPGGCGCHFCQITQENRLAGIAFTAR